jgi:hypothetical protein
VAAVEASIARLNAHQCQVIIVSFGERKGAEVWQEQMKSKSEIYLDKDRRLYASLGMKRSFSKVWGQKAMVYYAEKLLQNQELPQPVQGVTDDPLQMGGDIIFDQEGHPAFKYLSKTSSDRPTVEKIMEFLQNS